MSRLAAGVASRAEIDAVIAEVLLRGNAVDAVVAGVFAAAALDASVLLGPVQMLIGGAAAGLRQVDGRVRQAGAGSSRPRGVRLRDENAAALRVGVPLLPAALSSALALAGTLSLTRACAPAIELVKSVNKERADVIRTLGRGGPRAFLADGIADELIAVAGRFAGGLLCVDDFEALPQVENAAASRLGGRNVVRLRWRDDAMPIGARDGSQTEVIAACDDRGIFTAACYEVHPQGLPIDALGLVAPLVAQPLQRHVPWTPPGTPCPAAAPCALVEEGGIVRWGVGVGRSAAAEVELDQLMSQLETELTAHDLPRSEPGQRVVVAVTQTRATGRAVRR
jgi:gamma-glutamyltranspeptidase/glutathione hydrolase